MSETKEKSEANEESETRDENEANEVGEANEEGETREWTLMFYFASDNPLAPGIVSQLKAIKDAGYHPEVNVVTYFDPQPTGTPTHIFDVNSIRKLEDPTPHIGFVSKAPNDPYVRNLMEDKLWPDDIVDRKGRPIRELLQQKAERKGLTDRRPAHPSRPPQTASRSSTDAGAGSARNNRDPDLSLREFLRFCATEYRAKHYMLFILGHGLVVGDDVFLFDEHAARHSVTLRDLRQALKEFKRLIGEAEFELVSFHSCSMSSVEVAYELKDTANYMLASQGPAFVGSWPYRQILIRVFNSANGRRKKIEEIVEGIASSVLHNSKDFMLAGYSFDLCLCDLRKIKAVREPVKKLADALKQGLGNPMVTNCILLAHWKSQSYFAENYTDLFDFCSCLKDKCEEFGKETNNASLYEELKNACGEVIKVLKEGSSDYPIVLAQFAGPASQYSHGFSIYYPWTEPSADRAIVKEYPKYKFQKDTEWFDFLKSYWGPQDFTQSLEGSTMRAPSGDEGDQRVKGRAQTEDEMLDEDMLSFMFDINGPLSQDNVLDDPIKQHPRDPTGDVCTCGSIKNYPHDTRSRRARAKETKPTYVVPMTNKVTGSQTVDG